MEIIPPELFPRRDAAAFAEFLGYCKQVAQEKGTPQLASISLRVRHIDPLAVLQSIYEPGQLHAYMERPQTEEAIAGAEAVVEHHASGSERFVEIRIFAESIFKNTIAIGDMDADCAGPQIFCSFAFESEAEESGFPAGRAFVPRWQVLRRGAECFAVANIPVAPDAELEPLAKRVLAAHAKFSVFDYSGIPAQAAAPKVIQSSEASPQPFEKSVAEALRRIQAGRYEKIVISRAQDVLADKPFQPLETVNRLRARYPSCFCFSYSNGEGGSFIGATPERLVSVHDGLMQTEALAGSAPRGTTAREDARLASGLLASEKDLREHNYVVASIQQRLEALGLDLNITKQPGLLQLANVQHLRTPIQSTMPAGLHLLDVAAALHPTPAVGGRPREAAVKEIAELEGFQRGLFAGLIGGFNWQGHGELVVGLRSGFFKDKNARLYAGAGIVEGSDPAREKAETDLKLRALQEAIQGAR